MLVLGGFLLLGPLATVGDAHTNLIGTDPEDGLVLDTAPSTVRAYFDSEIEPASTIDLYDRGGKQIAGSGGLDLADLDRASLLFTPDAPLPNGEYVAAFAAVMVADGDTTEGSFSFEVAAPDVSTTTTTELEVLAAPPTSTPGAPAAEAAEPSPAAAASAAPPVARESHAAIADEPAKSSSIVVVVVLAGALVALIVFVMVRRLRHPIVIAVVIAAAILGSAEAASAHATFERADPEDGEFLAARDEPLRLWLSEPIADEFSSFTIRSTEGEVTHPASVEISVDGSGGLATIWLPDLPDGTYSINWRVLSELDGHFSQGIYVFGLGAPADVGAVDVGTQADEIPASESALRWLAFLGLAAAVGSLVLGALIFSNTPTLRRTLFSAGAAGATIALAAGIGLLVTQTVAASAAQPPGTTPWEGGARLVTETRWGAFWVGRQLALVVVAAALWIASRSTHARLLTTLAGASAVAAMAFQATSGHAVGVGEAVWVSVGADLAHLIAAASWTGALLLIALTLTEKRTGLRRRTLLRPVAVRFSAMAVLSVGVLAATGLYAAGRHVASLEALLNTDYGSVLIAKSALVAGVLVLGAMNASLLHPRLARPVAMLLRKPTGWAPVGRASFARLVTIEASLAAVVLLASGILTSAPPADGSEFAPGTREPVEAMSAEIDDLVVTVAVKPNRPGDNIYVVHAASTRRPTAAPIDRVMLRFDFGEAESEKQTITLDEIEPGRYQAGGRHLRLSGPWTVEAVVRRAGLPDAIAPFDWRVTAADHAGPTLSDRPLEPILTAAAVLALATLVVGGGAAWVLYRWPTTSVGDRPSGGQRDQTLDGGRRGSDEEERADVGGGQRPELIGSERT